MIEEELYQSEFWGEQPELPETFPPAMFGGKTQWDEIENEIITSEVSSVYPDFFLERKKDEDRPK